MELIEAVINLIGKFRNNSPVSNILDLPSLLSFRRESIGKWLCPNGVKKSRKTEHLHLCLSLQHKTLQQGLCMVTAPQATTQEDPHAPFTAEALVLDWTPRRTGGRGRGLELPDQQRSLELCWKLDTGPSALLVLSDRTCQPYSLMVYYV